MRSAALTAVLAALSAGAAAQTAGEAASQPAQPSTQAASEPSAAAPVEAVPGMTAALKDMLTYQSGKSADAIEAVAEIVKSATPEVRTQLVEYFVKVLDNKIKSTLDCRIFVCRQLALIGTTEAVDCLAKAMNSDDLFSTTVQSLEAIPLPQAGETLRVALKRFKGRQLISLIDSAGRRRDEQAIDALLGFVSPDNDAILAAAIAALSRIATPDAAAALVKAYGKAPSRYRPSIAQARLRVAREMVAAGKIDAAMTICEQLTGEDVPVVLRLSALHGLAATAPTRAAPVVTRLLINPDPAMAAKARELARSMVGSAVTEAMGRDMKDLDAAAQVALLGVLVERNDPAARSAIMTAAGGEHASARLAAVVALAKLGDAACVPMLAEMTGAEEPLAAAARATLRALQGRAVDQAIIWAIKPAKNNIKVELFRCLADRKTAWAVPELLQACTDDDEIVRSEAFKTLAAVAEVRYLPMLVRRMLAATGDNDRPAAESAVALCGRRSGDLDKAVILVAKSLSVSEDLRDRCSLLRAIGGIGGGQALKIVHAAAKDPNEAIRDAAAQCIINWPDASVLDDLIEIITKSENLDHHAAALRAYLRQAAALRRDNPAQALDMYRRALMLAKRDDEKRLVLSDIADMPSLDTLMLAGHHLADQALQSQAAASILVISRSIARQYRHDVTQALQAVLKTKCDGLVLSGARELLTALEGGQDHILSWKLAGPYTQPDKGPTELFDIPFPPETHDAPVVWRPITAGGDASRPWAVDLSKAVEGLHNCTAYLRTSIYSPDDRQAKLETGSDDGLRAWINGKQVIAANSRRGISIAQDHATVTLNKGWNVLLLKVTQADGNFAACARIRGADNKPIEGLRENADLP
ncbi:MAG: HEAT repeat domain-containing protein [Planctomycetaceae bacterium]|nr:HEAT repeat domain-containing protein [Planctomycetaceae bacterium]